MWETSGIEGGCGQTCKVHQENGKLLVSTSAGLASASESNHDNPLVGLSNHR
jgi:hypothetical protein